MLKSIILPGFILLVIAQWFVAGQMIWQRKKILSAGLSYKFETAPVDPSNPFLGKYIVMNFKENSLKLPGTTHFAYNSHVYVSFGIDKEGFAKIDSISVARPQKNYYLATNISYISKEKDSTTIFVNYPFTRYYMEEYKAPKAESIYNETRTGANLKTYALVKMYKGDAVIKNVYINDSLLNDVIQARNAVRQ